jgi:hypothetical protein
MALLTLLGGGYTVLWRLRQQHSGPVGPVSPIIPLAALGVFILSGANTAVGSLIALVFGILALSRGLSMLAWGREVCSSQERPNHLKQARPWRLMPAGVLLTLVSLFGLGMVVAFVGYYQESPESIEKELQAFMRHQLTYAREEEARTGQRRFDRTTPKELHEWFGPTSILRREVHADYGTEAQRFTVYITPCCTLLFFPYYYLTSRPTYRADDTGEIRMVYVHRDNVRCPADAPVVLRVDRNLTPNFDVQ